MNVYYCSNKINDAVESKDIMGTVQVEDDFDEEAIKVTLEYIRNNFEDIILDKIKEKFKTHNNIIDDNNEEKDK